MALPLIPIMLGLEAAGALGSAAIDYFKKRAEAKAKEPLEADKRRLEELRRLAEMGALGLSQEELDRLREEALRPTQRQFQKQAADLMARTGQLTGGQQARVARDLAAARAAAEGAARRSVVEADNEARLKQLAELRALERGIEAAQREADLARKTAALDAAQEALSLGRGYMQSATDLRMLEEESSGGTSGYYYYPEGGLSPEETEMYSYYMSIA